MQYRGLRKTSYDYIVKAPVKNTIAKFNLAIASNKIFVKHKRQKK